MHLLCILQGIFLPPCVLQLGFEDADIKADCTDFISSHSENNDIKDL